MERLNNCRICLQDDIPLRVIVGTHLQQMYEYLTSMPLETKDLRSTLACYICCARLQNCYRLRVNCLQSEELFTQILSSNVVECVEHKNKNAIRIAHPVVHLSIADDLQVRSDSDGNEEASEDVDDEQMIEDVQEAGDSNLGENSNDDSIQYKNTQDLLDIVKEELCDVETVGTPDTVEDFVEDKKVLSLHSEDPLSVAENEYELDENGTRVPVPKKIQHALQRYLVNLGANNHKKYEQEQEIHKLEQSKSDAAIALEFKPVTDNEYTHYKHTSEKPYQCHVYKIYFPEKPSLVNNIRIHTGEKPYQCDICKKCFTEIGKLNKHIRTHTGEKPHQCDVCKKCFTEKGSVLKHVRIHTSQKPYQCHVCNRCFKATDDLNRHHIRIHTGEKPYQCHVCKKYFQRKYSLKRHIRIHTGEKRVRYCSKIMSKTVI